MQRDTDYRWAFNRRQLLQSVGGGFGMLGLADMLGAASDPNQQAHFAPKANGSFFFL